MAEAAVAVGILMMIVSQYAFDEIRYPIGRRALARARQNERPGKLTNIGTTDALDDFGTIVISHCHSDHVGGWLNVFPASATAGQ